MNFDKYREAPFPNNLADALSEIRNLRRIMYNERQMLAKAIERRVLDNRASAGNIRAIKNENTELRKELQKTNEYIHKLEQRITGHE